MILKGLDLFMDLLSRVKYIVALTGAGISTNAGIPDFRGPMGFYTRSNIPSLKMFDIHYFRQDPTLFYENISQLIGDYENLQPTKGHQFLKKLEDLGKLKTIITQNIDGLHKRAGNTNVIEIHGNFETFYCIECGEVYPTDKQILKYVTERKVPHCAKCGGVLRPNVVFFGEPVVGLEKALTEVQRADMLLTMGTSLTVYPVAQLPSYIKDDAFLVIINQQPTPYDELAKIVLHEDIDEIVNKTKLLGD